MGLVGHLEPDKPRLRARVHSCFLDVWGGGGSQKHQGGLAVSPQGEPLALPAWLMGAEAKHVNNSHNCWLVLVQSPLCPWPAVVLLGPRLPLL